MKIEVLVRAAILHVGNRSLAVGVFCGERWYRTSSWRRYKYFGRLPSASGFHIGPIVFWDGS